MPTEFMAQVWLRLDKNWLRNKVLRVGVAAAYPVGAATYTAGEATYLWE